MYKYIIDTVEKKQADFKLVLVRINEKRKPLFRHTFIFREVLINVYEVW